jgi:DNA polymerase
MQRSQKTEQIQLLKKEVAKCSICTALEKSRKQTVFGDGDPDADIVLIGEAPGADEDEQGVPFVGQAGKWLNTIITKRDLRREDVFICNILRCRPRSVLPKNRPPRAEEAKNCRPFLDRTLDIVKPKVICCLGAVAAKRLLGSQYTTMDRMRGKVFDYDGIAVICTHHPTAHVAEEKKLKDMLKDFQAVIKAAKK